MNFPGMNEAQASKPDAAWHADEVIDYFVTRFRRGDFYILCPDNEVTPEMDSRRITWAYLDMLQNRPALSYWHASWQADFAAWMKS